MSKRISQAERYRRSQYQKIQKSTEKYHNPKYIDKMVGDRELIKNCIIEYERLLYLLIRRTSNLIPQQRSFLEWVKVKKAKLRIKYKVWRLTGFKYKR